MGTYLSTPVTAKGQESGEALECPAAPLVWGVVDCQGWRKSMEDAHVAQTDVNVPPHLQTDQDHDAKVFGVFDGHGGPEVARFTQLYLVDVFTKQPTWQKEPETNDHIVSPVGQALVDAFHALDRMIDQPERREELIRLRTEKPKPGEQRLVGDIPIPPEKIHYDPVDVIKIGEQVDEPTSSGDTKEENANSIELNEISSNAKKGDKVEESKKAADESKDESPVETETSDESVSVVHEKDDKDESESKDADAHLEPQGEPKAGSGKVADLPKTAVEEVSALNQEPPVDVDESKRSKEINGNESTNEEGDNTAKEDDSDAAVGKDEAAKLDQDLMLEDSEDEPDEATELTNRKVTVMFQKLLSLGGSSGQVSFKIANKSAAEEESTTEPSQSIVPTIVQNGRQICNLPDHPIHAGCTAIVAVLIGRKLTVANAGDSRAVLCRAGGRVEALSFDHKPQQHRELTRINNAGGFVNQFGRVNGNLNLSRSIGDLKYKQVPGIHPSGQMITAEPDIVEVYLQSNDEFFILGCDGIWDCLTNNQAVKYVRERIDTMPPTEIGVQMLDEIISDDPRATQGIGGDNMTVLIVDLQPGKRSYRNKTTVATNDP